MSSAALLTAVYSRNFQRAQREIERWAGQQDVAFAFVKVLITALRSSDWDIANLLVDVGADVTVRDSDGAICLHVDIAQEYDEGSLFA